ncbi:MAG: hypothetical protein GX492_10760 [Firmicutes bacterium]|nr:hypothetical protein [Bacillota bacterium]
MPYENGGLLYGRMNPSWVSVHDLSDAGPDSSRSTSGVVLDNSYLEAYTRKCIERQLYVVGTWHSHALSGNCHPSPCDVRMMMLLQSFYPKEMRPVFCITSFGRGVLEYRFLNITESGVPEELADVVFDLP